MNNFADRLIDSIRAKGNAICVGLDPRLDLMPQEITGRHENLKSRPNEYAARVIIDFNKAVIDAVADTAVAVKPQVAFYEQYGVPGISAFYETMAYAAGKGLIVIADVKRGDIASTAEAYALAYFKNSAADAVTVNPYMGSDSVQPFAKVAKETGKGIFVLVKTSNPGSKDFQDRIINSDGKDRRLYELVGAEVVKWGKELVGQSGYSSVCAVVGATFPEEAAVLRKQMPNAIFLVPGYGAQGATAKDLKGYFNNDGLGAIVNASRSIIFAYKEPGAADWQARIKEAVRLMKTDLETTQK
ncbi:MAG: orotidine-5'-phosphate decarboxylase [Candidatus Brocadiia bacterium]